MRATAEADAIGGEKSLEEAAMMSEDERREFAGYIRAVYAGDAH